MDDKIEQLQEWLNACSNLVFYSGMGVSLDSGLPDFRRMDGDHMRRYEFPPETIFSRNFLERKPGPFFRYYRDKVLAPLLTAEPNATHRKLVEIEQAGKLRRILTQNMDDLHQEAGSRKVLELYGSVMRNHCPLCERRLSALEIYENPNIPYCDVDMCGAVIGPDIVLYGDPLDKDKMTDAIYNVVSSDLFLVAGTSLQEYPAAAVCHYYLGKRMVLLNEGPTALDSRADLVIHGPIHEVMGRLRLPQREEPP